MISVLFQPDFENKILNLLGMSYRCHLVCHTRCPLFHQLPFTQTPVFPPVWEDHPPSWFMLLLDICRKGQGLGTSGYRAAAADLPVQQMYSPNP